MLHGSLGASQKSPFLAENQILCPQVRPTQERFREAERLQETRKEEETSGCRALKSGSQQQGRRLPGRQHLRIAVERDARHHHAGTGIPRIVLEQRQFAPRPQASIDYTQCIQTLLRRNVMEYAVYIAQVEAVADSA